MKTSTLLEKELDEMMEEMSDIHLVEPIEYSTQDIKDFNEWFSSLTEEQQKEYYESLIADYAIEEQKSFIEENI